MADSQSAPEHLRPTLDLAASISTLLAKSGVSADEQIAALRVAKELAQLPVPRDPLTGAITTR